MKLESNRKCGRNFEDENDIDMVFIYEFENNKVSGKLRLMITNDRYKRHLTQRSNLLITLALSLLHIFLCYYHLLDSTVSEILLLAYSLLHNG